MKKAHELVILIPSHPCHQGYLQRGLRCGHQEVISDSVEFKEEHPKVVQWITPIYISENNVANDILEAMSKFSPYESPGDYNKNESNLSLKYQQGHLTLHTLMRFWHSSLLDLYIYMQKHPLLISEGAIEDIQRQTTEINDSIVTDAYTLIVLAMCDCLEMLAQFQTVYITYSTITLLQNMYLTEDNIAGAAALHWVENAINVIICQNGSIGNTAIKNAIAADVIPCCNTAVSYNIPYMSCETVVGKLLDAHIKDLPGAKYVTVVAAINRLYQDHFEVGSALRNKLLKQCRFINFNAADIFANITINDGVIDKETLKPYLCFKSDNDPASFVLVYFGVAVALKDQLTNIDDYFQILTEYAGRIWSKGQYYRQRAKDSNGCDADAVYRATAMNTFIVQLVCAIYSFYDIFNLDLPDELSKWTRDLINTMITECKLSQQDINEMVQPLLDS